MRIWSWNMGRRLAAWQTVADAPAVDVVLAQEALRPPNGLPFEVTPSAPERWETVGTREGYRTAISWRGDRIQARAGALGAIGDDSQYVLCVSREGTLASLEVRLGQERITLISAYAFWEAARSAREQMWMYADASAHRIISDVAALIDSEADHRLIVAGDFNVLHGYGDAGSDYWNARDESVFTRFETLGLTFVGPQAPDGGRQADPWPEELPRSSRNVPTCFRRGASPASASRQLDYVFASRTLVSRMRVRALNSVDEWGPSDHCRIEILLDEN